MLNWIVQGTNSQTTPSIRIKHSDLRSIQRPSTEGEDTSPLLTEGTRSESLVTEESSLSFRPEPQVLEPTVQTHQPAIQSIEEHRPITIARAKEKIMAMLVRPELTTIRAGLIDELGQNADTEPLNFNQWQNILTATQKILLEMGVKEAVSGGEVRNPCISELEDCYTWCASYAPLYEREVHSLHMERPQDLLRVLTVICHSLRGLSYNVDESLLDLMVKLQSVTEGSANVHQWSEISLACKKLRDAATEAILAAQHNVKHPLALRHFSLPFIQDSLKYLAQVSNVNWVESAGQVVMENLIKHYFGYFDPAHSEFTTGSVTVAQNIIPTLQAEGTAGFKSGSVVDREGYIGLVEAVTASATVGWRAGLEKLHLACLNLTGSESIGSYIEYNQASDLIKDRFAEYINKNKHNRELVPFTCRNSVLRKETCYDDQITLQNLSQIRDKYRSKQRQINFCFETLLTSPTRLHQPVMASEETSPSKKRPIIVLPAMKDDGAPPLVTTIKTVAGKGEGRLGLRSPFARAEAGLAGEANKTEVPIERRKNFVEKIMELEELEREEIALSTMPGSTQSKDKSANVRKEITEEIQSTAERLLKKLPKDALQYTEPASIADNLCFLLSKLLDYFFSLLPQTSAATEQWPKPDDYQVPTGEKAEDYFPIAAHLGESENDRSKKTAHGSYLTEVTGLVDMDDLNVLQSNLKTLRRDFEYLSMLKTNSRVPTTKLSLQQFYKLYLTDNVEDCLYRMQLLNAYFYICLKKKEDNHTLAEDGKLPEKYKLAEADQLQIERFKKKIRKFEQLANNPPFTVNRKKLNKLARVIEDAVIKSSEEKVMINGDLSVSLPGSSTLHPVQVTGSRTFKKREHINPLTDGEFIELELKFGGTLPIIAPMVDGIMSILANDVRLKDLPGLREQIAQRLSIDGSVSANRSIVWQWEKTTLIPGIESTYLLRRDSNFASKDQSLYIPTPFVSTTIHSGQQKTTLTSEGYAPDTIQMFFLRHFHDYAIGNIKEDGAYKENEHVYWKIVEEQQKESLQKLFINIAGRNEQTKTATALKKELDGFHEVFKKDLWSNTEFHKTFGKDASRAAVAKNLDDLQEALYVAAENYRSHPEDANNYATALAAFKGLLLGYAPHLKHMKTNSALFTPRTFKLPLTLPRKLPPVWARRKNDSGLVPNQGVPGPTELPLSARQGLPKATDHPTGALPGFSRIGD